MSEPNDHMLLPLPLAEMLHATLGPLAEVLAAEGHAWAPLLDRVLEAYRAGRDDQMVKKYGPAVIPEVDIVTAQVAEAVCSVVSELASEEVDFMMWASEFDARAE